MATQTELDTDTGQSGTDTTDQPGADGAATAGQGDGQGKATDKGADKAKVAAKPDVKAKAGDKAGAKDGEAATLLAKADAQAKADAKAAAVPETYGLALADDSPLAKTDAVAAFEAAAKAAGITDPAHAKALFGVVEGQAQGLMDSLITASAKGGALWADNVAKMASAALQSYGGDQKALDADIQLARQFLDKHGDPGLLDVLEETGLGSHAAVIRTFASQARRLADTPLVPGASVGSKKPNTPEERMGYTAHKAPSIGN